MTDFEWWTLYLAVAAIIVPFVLALFAKGFARWADRLDNITTTIDERLEKMSARDDVRWEEMKSRLTTHENKFHNLQVCVERRMTRIETKVDDA